MARELSNSVSEDGKINPHVVKRQSVLLKKMRDHGYALDPALDAANIPKSTFLRWYQEDETFRESFLALEGEQMPLLRQTLRELASGVHPSCDGKPDKTVLRYVVAEYDKRNAPDEDPLGELGADLERLTREQLSKLT